MKNFLLKMNYSFRLDDVLLKQVNNALVDLPSPKNISYFWNLGVRLGSFLIIQLVRGILLACWFIGDIKTAFECVDLISRDVDYGWILRLIHAKGASFFFICMYLHIGRGFYYFSFYYTKVWLRGIVIFILSMGIGFFGYVLPWGQMSYWAATVITNLFSVCGLHLN